MFSRFNLYAPSVAPALGGWVHAADGGRHLVPMPSFLSGYETEGLTCAFTLRHSSRPCVSTREGIADCFRNETLRTIMSRLRVPRQEREDNIEQLLIRQPCSIPTRRKTVNRMLSHNICDSRNVSMAKARGETSLLLVAHFIKPVSIKRICTEWQSQNNQKKNNTQNYTYLLSRSISLSSTQSLPAATFSQRSR